MRYRSGALDGQYGVELWMSLVQPVGFGDKEIYLEAGDVAICHKDARRLLAHIEKADVELWVYVIHAPHSGRSEAEISGWWAETTEILTRRRQGGRVVVLGDCNAKTGRKDGIHVFDQDDNEGKTTVAFRMFLEDAELCVPATSDGHTGEQTTWTTPNGENEVRIDYALVGCGQVNEVQLSQVVQEIDLGDLAIDHRPVGLQLEWWVEQRTGQWTQNFDRQKVHERTDELQKDLGAGVVAEWDVDIEEHVDDYTRQIHQTLKRHAPKERGAPKKPFIGEALWKLRSEKRESERCLEHTKRLIDREYLALYFQAWTGRKTSRSCIYGWKAGAVRLAATLRHKGRLLRQGIRDAKNDYVNEIVGEFTPQDSASDILRGLRPVIGTSNMRKRKGQSLPQVRDKDGKICDNKTDAVNAWVDYFTAMEGGERLQADEQRVKWIQGLEDFQQDEVELEVRECPNLVEMEQAFRRIKDGKAVGLDGVIPEVCRRCSKELARLSYTQLLKLMCHGQEAILHKGGTLAVAYKKGERDVCNSFRSLLVSSHQGKTIHRALRQKQCHLYVAYQQAQQLGGRPRVPVTFAGHLGRAFQRFQVAQGRCHGLLFLDLQEAYYRILRPLAVGGAWDDEQISAMAARLGLEGDTLSDLYENLKGPNALELARVPRTHRQYIQAIHTDTFFVMKGQRDRSRTLAGSRPGDSFADIVFGYLWAKLLKQYEKMLQDFGLLECFPAVSGVGLETSWSSDGEVQVLGPTWCDDLCVFFSADTAERLVKNGGVLAGLLIDLCKSHGMTPNLKRQKSEMMLSLRGKGSRHWRGRYAFTSGTVACR